MKRARTLPRGISRRGRYLWLTYPVPRETAVRYGCKQVQRESAKTGDLRAAKSLLAKRHREVKDGSWRPAKLGGAGVSVQTYAERWTADRQRVGLPSAKNDMQHLAPVLERLGSMRLGDVRRIHVKEAMAEVRMRDTKRGGAPAPTTVIKTYAVLRAMFGEAVRAELILATPCTLRMDGSDLPRKRDANPRWRKGAVFTREELERLISDDRIPQWRRMVYTLLGLTGMRIGEAAARTWADYDASAEPLGRLMVETQADPDDDESERQLKTGAQREVPVHPLLARLLAEWNLEGYALAYGAVPQPSDLIVRNAWGNPLQSDAVWLRLQADLAMLGMRRRRTHDLRRTLTTLARADGANVELLRWVTHGPSKQIMDLYTSPPWETLCEQVACLRVGLRGGAVRQLREPGSAHGNAQSGEMASETPPKAIGRYHPRGKR